MNKININAIDNSNIRLLLQTAEKLGIAWELLDLKKLKIKFTNKNKTYIIHKKSLGLNSKQSIHISRSKQRTQRKLKQAGLAVLPQKIIKKLPDWEKNKNDLKFPLVIKPVFGEKGKDVFLNITDRKKADQIIHNLLPKKSPLIVEPFFKGKDFRFLVLNNQVIGCSHRKPPVIIGDGKNTIKKLIEKENQRRERYNHQKGLRMLNRMRNWERTKQNLEQQGYSLDYIPDQGKKVHPRLMPNFSTGGTVTAIPINSIDPDFKKTAVKTAQTIGLTIAGIDILAKDIKKPTDTDNCAIIEVNSDPGLRLHDLPNHGHSQKVAFQILQFVFNRPCN